MECEKEEDGCEADSVGGNSSGNDERSEPVDEVSRRIRKYKKSEMVNRLYFYETVWDTLDDTTKFLLSNIGNMVGITARNYGYRVGILLSMVFEPKLIRFATKEKIFDSALGGFVFDTKVSSVLFNNLLSYDIISKREIEEMVEVPEEEGVATGV